MPKENICGNHHKVKELASRHNTLDFFQLILLNKLFTMLHPLLYTYYYNGINQIIDMIIFLTSRTDQEKERTENFLKKHHIPYDAIIYNAPYGERILVNDRKPSGLRIFLPSYPHIFASSFLSIPQIHNFSF